MPKFTIGVDCKECGTFIPMAGEIEAKEEAGPLEFAGPALTLQCSRCNQWRSYPANTFRAVPNHS